MLEKRALRYKNKAGSVVNDNRDSTRFDSIDETGTVDTAGLTVDDSGDEREESLEEMNVRKIGRVHV